MPNVRHILSQLEIAFWAYAIRVMRESSVIQSLIRRVYELPNVLAIKPYIRRLIAMAFAGWLAGFTIGIIAVWLDTD